MLFLLFREKIQSRRVGNRDMRLLQRENIVASREKSRYKAFRVVYYSSGNHPHARGNHAYTRFDHPRIKSGAPGYMQA